MSDADIEKEYSKLALQEENLRTLRELSGRNTAAPESKQADAEINPDSIRTPQKSVAADEQITQSEGGRKDEAVLNLKKLSEALPFFCTLKDMESVLSKYWETLSGSIQAEDYREANLIITSISGNGKTTLGRMIGEAVVTAKRNSVNDSLLLISAETFNGKDIPGIYKQYVNGCILIQDAEKLSNESIQTLKLLMNIGTKHPLIILETPTDKRNELGELIADINEHFRHDIEIPVLDDNALAEFAVYYANSLEFDIDRVAVLTIHHLIENRQSYSHHVNLAEIVGFVEQATAHYGRNLFKKLIFSKTRHEFERPVLTERDFERI